MAHHDTDSNLLFGVIALQSGLIDMQQFVDGCTLWSTRKDTPLADLLVERGILVADDRKHIAYLLERRTKKEGGDARRSLAAVPNEIKTMLAGVEDDAIRASLQAIDDVTDPQTAAFPGPIPQLREKIQLKGLHSTGGIGQVWIAFDRILGREIALKELRADKAGSHRNRERFFREAQLTGRLEHPGIVPVYEYSAHADGRCYYTMRFVRGRTLTETIRAYYRDRSRSAPGVTGELIRLLHVFVTVCQTIAYAHSRSVIHRDLKGDNIILGDFGEVIVLDWGLAKRLSEAPGDVDPVGETLQATDLELNAAASPTATMQGEKLGTPAYMAPEQARGQIDRIDHLTDVYGLAAILYEILLGRPPFLGASIIEVLHRVIHDPPESLCDQDPGIPRELEHICLRGLSKDPADRQQSATELAGQIEHWIAERAERKRTEQERERFFNLSLDLLAIVDAYGNLKQTNPAWKTVLGWDSDELAGKSIRDILHSDEHHHLSESMERILAGESITAVDRRCICKDGTYRWILWNASLIAGEASIYIVGRDVTERKQTEQTFQQLLESAPDGMAVVNDAGHIVLVNSQLERLFGFTREELLGQPIEVLVPEEIRARHPAYVARFFATPDFRPMASDLKLYGRHKDGHVFPVEISLSPVRTEQGLLVSCAVRTVRSGRAADGQMAADLGALSVQDVPD